MSQPFDAVLVIAFGGPQGPADVRPFLENVLRGRRVAPGRIDEVAHHYDLFGGISPLTELTMRQAVGLRERLEAAGAPLPVHVGMRNWHPYLTDTIAEMSNAGVESSPSEAPTKQAVAGKAISGVMVPSRIRSRCLGSSPDAWSARVAAWRGGNGPGHGAGSSSKLSCWLV